ncbi:hypothetical protein KIL84_022906 [Mauremys mutica]|uniref:Uncharacterized protein n=1 Tax=Mauremys mutica TaxID=74926 RepID=A0A9D3WQL8_9SAUR|nr:hypothetical protein KIL84_022906 [Mauremys mutica]
MSDIGHVIQEIGFGDIVVEVNICDASVNSHALRRKAYNNSVRIHRFMNEEMNCLKWIALGDSMNNDPPADEKRCILEKAQTCIEAFDHVKKAHRENRLEALNSLTDFLNSTQSLLTSLWTLRLPKEKNLFHYIVFSEQKCSRFLPTTDDYILIMHYMAIKQSLNKDRGKHQHICTKDKALTKYHLTTHFKTAVTAVTKQMCGMPPSSADSPQRRHHKAYGCRQNYCPR